MTTRGFLLYLLSGFSVAILSVLFINKNNNMYHNSTLLHSPNVSSVDKDWPVSIFLSLNLLSIFGLSMVLICLMGILLFLFLVAGIGVELEACTGNSHRISGVRMWNGGWGWRRRHFCSNAYLDCWIRYQICCCYFQM